MLNRYLQGDTGVFGLIGSNIHGSLSPIIHNTAMRFLKLNSVYV